jgi:lipopolysaccharide transport system ATP-binding protein
VSDIAIKVEGLSKLYRIGAKQARYKTLRESIMSAVMSPFQRLRNLPSNFIWALKDVSFEVKRGEVTVAWHQANKI